MANILLVEDEENLRSMLRIVLEDAGHEVAEAGNGKEVVEIYRRRPPDLLITDIIMPDEEGIETIIKVRKNFPHAKIIAMSGGGRTGTPNYLDLARKLGANHILAKPFSNRDFLSGIEMVLRHEQ
jgi:DNA-binding response OmpR family regulator